MKRAIEHPRKPQALASEGRTKMNLMCYSDITGTDVSEPYEVEGPVGFTGLVFLNARPTTAVNYQLNCHLLCF